MSATLKKLAAMLALTAILLSLISANMKFAFSEETGVKIDIYTQKEPYSGKGLNMVSDAFGPEEVVILYSLVTFNGVPVQNLLVSYNINTPTNKSFTLTSKTDTNGIAKVDFTILTPPISLNESEVFGTWFVMANVKIENEVYTDTSTFRVDWVVKLLSVVTINGNRTSQTSFGLGGDVGLKITLRSIAMITKSATIAIVIKDELDHLASYLEISDFMVSPNEKLVYLYTKLYVSKSAVPGDANVFVSALNSSVSKNGVAHCPEISGGFYLSPTKPLNITYHDIAIVDVTPSPKSVELGQTVNVSVIAQNEGMETETFNVSAYYDSVLIGTQQVTLALYSHRILNFTINTSGFGIGNYTTMASIPVLVEEADETDNVFVGETFEVKSEAPLIIHDIAITNISLSNTSVYIGGMLYINVSIFNKGTETETFNVSTYCDAVIIETLQVISLASNASIILNSVWDTNFVPEGIYQISALAPLQNDVNVSNNIFIDGLVQVKTKPQPPRTHILNLTSSPITNVSFLISGSNAKTPYSETLNEGAYTVIFPLEWTDLNTGKHYVFSSWEGSSKNATRTINLVSNMMLVAYYEEIKYTLTLSTTTGGTTSPFPGTYRYPENTPVTARAFPNANYLFDYWVFDAINRTENPLNILMDRNHTLVAHFKAVPAPAYRLSVTSDPILGLNFTIDAVRRITPYSAMVHKANYTIVMNRNFRDPNTGWLYEFDRWEDNSKNPMRIVFLDRDMNLTAYYKRALEGWFVPDWIYWLFIPFSILILALLLIWFFAKRRKKRSESFYTGWTAWYYGYDMRNKLRKT